MKTAEQLASMADDGNRYELIAGELVVFSPAGARHGRIALRLNTFDLSDIVRGWKFDVARIFVPMR